MASDPGHSGSVPRSRHRQPVTNTIGAFKHPATPSEASNQARRKGAGSEVVMPQRRRDLIEVLRFELNFLQHGGYGSASTPWKPQSIFQDSLTCLNFKRRSLSAVSPRGEARTNSREPRVCDDCELREFVPPDSHQEAVPCHHIPLNDAGQTIATLDRGHNLQELQEAVIVWLRQTIARLETESEPQRGTAPPAR